MVITQVSSWGGYVFLINLIPMHVLALMLTGRFSHRVYIAYSTVRTIMVYVCTYDVIIVHRFIVLGRYYQCRYHLLAFSRFSPVNIWRYVLEGVGVTRWYVCDSTN